MPGALAGFGVGTTFVPVDGIAPEWSAKDRLDGVAE